MRKFGPGRQITAYFLEFDAIYTGKIIGLVGEKCYECEGQDDRGRPARFVVPSTSIL